MTDGELQTSRAASRVNLTEVAWESLEDELDRRNLELPPRRTAPAPAGSGNPRRLMTIRQFRDLPEALLAKGSLESAGIECFSQTTTWSDSTGSFRTSLAESSFASEPEDAENARKHLDEPILEGLYVHRRSDSTSSRAVPNAIRWMSTFRNSILRAYLSMAFRVPIPVHRSAWHCRACDAEWEDDGFPGENFEPLSAHVKNDFAKCSWEYSFLSSLRVNITGFRDGLPLTRLSVQPVESFLNYVQRIFGQIQRGQFFAGEPADFGGVAGGLEFAPNRAAEEIDQHVVILHALLRIAQDAVVDAEQFAGFDDQSGFFAGLADGGFADQFADFEDASGDRPLALNAADERA